MSCEDLRDRILYSLLFLFEEYDEIQFNIIRSDVKMCSQFHKINTLTETHEREGTLLPRSTIQVGFIVKKSCKNKFEGLRAHGNILFS